jgi:DNA-binding transcriptional LysR family regulator
MNFTLQQLIIFRELCATKSVTKTSEKLHLTQPAISIQLKNLQSQFDQPIFETIGKKIHITSFGVMLNYKIESIIKELEDVQLMTQTMTGELQGQLKIAVVSTGKYVMPYFLSDFLGEHSGIELQMEVSNKQQVIERLKNNEVDFALVSILPEKLNLTKLDLVENKLYMIGRQLGQKKNKSKSIKLNDCHPLIYREPGSGTRQTMEKFIERKKIQPIKAIELTSNEAVKQAILAGMGYSIMPLIGLRNELKNKELEILPIPGLPIKTTWQLVWLKEKKITSVAKAYLQFVSENKTKIVNKHFNDMP